jgi:hypothetical protein
MIWPLIDARSVCQTGMGRLREELPLSARTLTGVKAVVLRVLPVGHPDNRSGQTLCDLQPRGDLPILRRVPIATPDAHEETQKETARSSYRQPYDPKARNRMSGATADVRPGSFVWVQFHNGSIWDPVITANLKFNQLPADQAPEYAQLVDRIDADGNLVPTPTRPVDSDMDANDKTAGSSSYPRRVQTYNGCRVEVDNKGNHYVQTSTDRKPLYPGHDGVPESPDPEGSYGVSTRGAVVGHIGFTTGRNPSASAEEQQAQLDGRASQSSDDTSKGRHFRRSIDAEDGTIRDSTRSKLGHIIHRVRAGKGRMWSSTQGASDGRVYQESAQRDYVALGKNKAELHGESTVTLDGPTVKLGSVGVGDEIVLWPQLCQVLEEVFLAIDLHVHDGVETGEGSTNKPTEAVTPTFTGGKSKFKAADVHAGQSSGSSPHYQDDPEDE